MRNRVRCRPVAFTHAKQFAKSVGVDVSQTMLNKLMANAEEFKIKNVTPYLSSENRSKNEFSYVYSFIGFQHIPNMQIIEDYILNMGKALKVNWLAKLHFDTRENTILYQLRNSLPDFLLPKDQKKGIRRIRRSAEQLKLFFKHANLTIVKETGANITDHIFTLKRNS